MRYLRHAGGAGALGVMLAGWTAPLLAAQEARIDTLPTRYAAHRWVAAPVLASGDTLALYTDTGGGTNMLWPATLERLGLTAAWVHQAGDSMRVVSLPAMRAGAAIPLPAAPPPLGARFLVFEPEGFAEYDGFLSRTWFANRTWIFDYPSETLMLVQGPAPSPEPGHRVPLAFQTDSAGNRTTNFPRITAVVDGDTLDLLFDTGATTTLTPGALEALNDGGPAVRATSFVTRSVFQRWRSAHPGWRVIEQADAIGGAPMIEVPRMTIAGHEVGPVWFTGRPDTAFREYMAQWMDRPLDGALGGSALRYFKVVVNYPEGYAEFATPGGRAD